MLDALTRLFSRQETVAPAHDPKLAVAALLVHLAAVDGAVKDEEREAVKGALTDFYRFTSALSSLDDKERIEIVRMMWTVVFADKKNHELEDNMVWRIAELIGVSARDRTILRNQMSKKA